LNNFDVIGIMTSLQVLYNNYFMVINFIVFLYKWLGLA